MALNRVVVFGRLTKDVEVKQYGENYVFHNSVAVARSYKNKNGEYDTDFFDVEYWTKAPQFITNNFHKGSRALISGELATNKYQAQDGSNRVVTFIKANKIDIVDFKNAENSTQSKPTQSNPSNFNMKPEELPF